MAHATTLAKRESRKLPAALRAPEWGLVVGIAAVLALIYTVDSSHKFFAPISQQTLLHQIALFGVLSLGAAIVIISGGIDLSIGSVVGLAGIVSAKLLRDWLRSGSTVEPSLGLVIVAIALTLLLGLAIGLLHAGMITFLRLPPFIATLATMAGLRSVAMIISHSDSINVKSPYYRVLGKDPYVAVGIFAALAAALSVVMGATILGRHLFAMGGNEQAARLSGLPIARLKAVAYGLSGTLAALGGILFTGRSGQATPTLGVSYELYAITAAVVGGCSLSGGVGSIRGTVLGLLLIQIVIKGTALVVTGVNSTEIEGLVLGTVIVLAVAFNARFRGRG